MSSDLHWVNEAFSWIDKHYPLLGGLAITLFSYIKYVRFQMSRTTRIEEDIKHIQTHYATKNDMEECHSRLEECIRSTSVELREQIEISNEKLTDRLITALKK